VDREERCEIDEPTRVKVLEHSDRLKDYDVTVKPQQDGGLSLDFEGLLDDAPLREVVLLLWDNDVPPEQILRLRLDEPELIDGLIREGIDLLRHGTGKLTQEFRSHVLHSYQANEGDIAQRASAEAALQQEFEALVVATNDKDENWDETDKRVYKFMKRIEDQRLPLWAQIPRAIAGLEG